MSDDIVNNLRQVTYARMLKDIREIDAALARYDFNHNLKRYGTRSAKIQALIRCIEGLERR